MAEARPSMLYVQPTAPQEGQAQPTQQQQPVKEPGWLQTHMEKTRRAAWTALCFVVFCGFSFFLGWHLKGWHFSAYYDAPGGSYLGAKPAAVTVPTEPDPQISQATVKVPGNAD
jgi:hypothetical protein